MLENQGSIPLVMATAPGAHQDPASWQAGYNAGMSGASSVCPPEVPDRFAYASGYIEGKAARARATASRIGESDDK
jgi:hypothetical protein